MKPETGFASEIKIVPHWAWVTAAIFFVAVQWIFLVLMGGDHNAPPAGVRLLLGLGAGALIGCYILLIGYVNRDAGRRDMNRTLWTLVAIFVTNGMGLILYFILRRPIATACPQCGGAVQTNFNYCPNCNYKLGLSCPQCQRTVSFNDVYCPYCGTAQRR